MEIESIGDKNKQFSSDNFGDIYFVLILRWVTVDHHVAHAALGFYDSPFQRALVLSYDGGGNDGTFNVYSAGRTSGVKHLEWVNITGKCYFSNCNLPDLLH